VTSSSTLVNVEEGRRLSRQPLGLVNSLKKKATPGSELMKEDVLVEPVLRGAESKSGDDPAGDGVREKGGGVVGGCGVGVGEKSWG